MNADPHPAKAIFLEAVEKHRPDQWPAFLDQACADQPELRRRVEGLLAAHREAGTDPHQAGTEGAAPALGQAGRILESLAPDRAPTINEPIRERPGTVIGPYKLLEQIGEGGFGIVFMAEQQQPIRRKVALKVLKPGMDTRQVVVRFEAERQALALMDHPNIAHVFDGGETPTGRPFFVMELVRGVPITSFCDQNQLNVRQRLELFASVCQAVQHAHQKGIIHRDLKPSNVLVTSHDGTPVVKVIDFGIAKATGQQLTDKTLFTNFAQMVGTPLYMSPEQAGRSGLDVDTRSDIYSLGVLLYELLTGTTPFTRERLRNIGYDELRRIICEEEPPRPSTRVSTLGQADTTTSAPRQGDSKGLSRLLRGELDWIVMRALEKDRNRRYETASAFAADVQRYLHDKPVLACPPSRWYRFRKFARRNKAALATAALVSVILLLVLVGAPVAAVIIWQQWTRAEAAREVATQQKGFAEEQRTIARQKQTEAEDKAATTKAVYNFFVFSMLRAPDPDLALGRKLTVLDALANADEKIGTAFPDRPLVEADVRYIMATTYSQLGEYKKAQLHYERALALWTRHLGRDKRLTLQAMNGLAVVLERRGKPRESIALQEATLRLQLQVLGPEDKETLLSQNNLVTVLHDLGRLKEARQLCEKTLAARTRLLGPAHPDTLVSLEGLCLLLADQGEWGEARKRQEETLERLTRILPPEHPNLYRLKHNLAHSLRKQGKLKAARKMLAEVVAARTRILGPDHPRTLLSRSSLAFVLAEQGNLAEARKMLEETKERLVVRLGEEHEYTLGTMNDLATVLLRLGQGEQARLLLQKVVALRTATLGEEHRATLTPMLNLAVVLKEQGKLPQARKVIEKTLTLAQKVHGEKHPFTVQVMGAKADILYHQHELQPALELCQQVVALKKQLLGPKHRNTLIALATQALILAEQGKRQEARDLLERNLVDFKEVLGPKDPDTLKTMQCLAYMVLEEIRRKDLHRLAEARQRFEEVAALREEVLGPDHPDTLNSKWGLVEVLLAGDQIPAVVKVFHEIVASRSRLHGPGHARTLDARNDCAVMLSNAGKFAEARKLHEENLEQSRRYLGPEHPSTLDTIRRLAQVINVQATRLWLDGKLPEAEKTFREGLALIESVESKFLTIKGNYRETLGWLCHNLARFLVLSPEPRPEQTEEAVKLAHKAVKLTPPSKFRLPRHTLALAQYRSGDLKAARATMDSSMADSKGGDCREWFLLAMIQWRAGEKDAARQWFQRAARQMDETKLQSDMARSLRAEAARLLGIKDTTGSKEGK
jgi:serine/threonine protein kinase